MSASIRQNELFAGEDWTVLYRAFTSINFNASDPPSIALALRQYLQANYPEDFDDWVESDEFVFILELLAWLAGTLAFKTDINARENFLDTAQARESILRLARFLSYNPSRNQAATGLVKIIEVETDDDVLDAYGASLANQVVVWDNPDDPDWFENFVIVLNNALVQNNPFGQPLMTGTVGGVASQLYRMNNRDGDQTFSFSASPDGTSMAFEICDGTFTDGGTFTERAPNADNAFQFFYRSDGLGNSSTQTGFFMLFKQGSSGQQYFNISTPIANQLIDINTTGVNNTDVWVNTVNDSGTVITQWTKVPVLFSDNMTFNSLPVTARNIFQVISRDQDMVTLRFSDGSFGNAPYGNIQVCYRVSNGLTYTIRPQDIDSIRLPFLYTNSAGVSRTLYVTFSLQTTVSNSTPTEDIEDIRRRAPQVYATQNRMVSGEDYNVFPLQTNLAVKVKAVNRTYSGHSRFIDLNDPTSNYQDTNVVSDDGLFYQEPQNLYTEIVVGLGESVSDMITQSIQPLLSTSEAANYAWSMLFDRAVTAPQGAMWKRSTGASFSSTGYFTGMDAMTVIRQGAIVQVLDSGKLKWVAINSITSAFNVAPQAGYAGPVTLSMPISDGATVLQIVPRWIGTLDGATFSAIESKLSNNTPFTLWFNYNPTGQNPNWEIDGPDSPTTPMFDDTVGVTRLKMLVANRFSGLWQITVQGLRYIFESERNVQWYFDGEPAIDQSNGTSQSDLISILAVNEDLAALDTSGALSGRALQRPYNVTVDKMIVYSDGFAEPNRISVVFADTDDNGVPDDPDTFVRVIGSTSAQAPYLFWQRQSDDSYLPYYNTVVFAQQSDRVGAVNTLPVGTVAFELASGATPTMVFYTLTTNGQTNSWTPAYSQYRFRRGRGANVAQTWYNAGGAVNTSVTPLPLMFQWKHYSTNDHRIDPSQTNIIDMFVLTTSYDYAVRQWVASGASISEMPLPPTELDLSLAFSQLDEYKMFSDEIVWRPASYKFLFGAGADSLLQAQFKVVKLANSNTSDGDVKSQVINAINTYFNVANWDFGETFYFTELAAYIHQTLAGQIASVAIVPLSGDSSFGNGFEINCRSDELFISTAQVSDVVIITSNTASNLRIR